MIFISVSLGRIDFSDIVMLRSGPNSFLPTKQYAFFNMPLLSLDLFHEGVAMTVKQI